jgi:hypothetical protein|tara:strand:- start:918 stop:1151 length:234 start_codon:yes stop_codon:yes gene_type:complete
MEILYNNKAIVSISVGLFISTLYYNFNKVNNEKDNKYKDYTIAIFFLISIFIYAILHNTEENVNDVMNEIDTGEPDF